MKNDEMNRRRFLKAGVIGLAGSSLLTGCAAGRREPEAGPSPEPGVRKYNVLGRTGLMVSDVSLGGACEKPVLRYALDRGINLYDTAEQYHGGEHEAYIGEAFRDVRGRVIVVDKHVHGLAAEISRQDVITRFDDSLSRMGFDYIDIAMLHHVADPAMFEHEELLGAYETLKREGKFRFFGFSTHDAEAVIPAAVKSGIVDVMLVIYNSIQYPKRSELIGQAHEAGIGVMAMKTMAGRQQDRIVSLVNEKTTFSQAAIKWALTDDSIDSVCISMRTFEHVDQYLGASGQVLTAEDEATLARYEAAVDHQYCRIGCTTCEASCPESVAVSDIMRFGMYYENYGEQREAMREYASLSPCRRADGCRACAGPCEPACPHGLEIRKRMMHYHSLLG
jgi:predicted aldo/keto reductase-like oxidoreductase